MVRKLGRSAHPYLLVSYFSFIATLAGLVGTFTFEKPAIPDNWREWGVWLVIGLSGFVFFFFDCCVCSFAFILLILVMLPDGPGRECSTVDCSSSEREPPHP